MTLFELQAWLGHRSPESTQHYAKITQNTLAKAYNDAGYFARNVRTGPPAAPRVQQPTLSGTTEAVQRRPPLPPLAIVVNGSLFTGLSSLAAL